MQVNMCARAHGYLHTHMRVVQIHNHNKFKKITDGLSMNMEEKYPRCPECGYTLSLTMQIDSETKEIMIDMFCEGPAEDVFHLQIKTGLTQEDIELLDNVGETFPAETELMERKADPEQNI